MELGERIDDSGAAGFDRDFDCLGDWSSSQILAATGGRNDWRAGSGAGGCDRAVITVSEVNSMA